MSNDIELDSLGQRTALSNRHNITLLHGEAGATMSMNVLMALLETTVLCNVVKIIPTNDNRALHLGRDDKSLQNFAADRNIAGEGTLLIDIVSLDGRIGGLNAQTNVLHPAHGLDLFGINISLARDEDGILGLVRLFVLYREPSPHE
jgi:hypothetical protein